MNTNFPRLLLSVSTLSGLLLCTPTGAVTDISNTPLITNQVSVKPNLMFILDNSGSMTRAYIPEEMSSTSRYGFRTPQCNGAAFDAAKSYDLPVTPDGRSYPNMALNAAWADGFNPDFGENTIYSLTITINSVLPAAGTQLNITFSRWSDSDPPFAVGDPIAFQRSGRESHWISGTVASISGSGSTRTVTFNLNFSSLHDGSHNDWRFGRVVTANLTSSSSAARRVFRYKGEQPAMSWSYDSAGSANTSTTFYKECMSSVGNAPGRNVFDEVLVSSTDFTDSDRQKYANWYSYYRTRIAMMRSATGRAMSGLGSDYRVGFNTLNRVVQTSSGPSFPANNFVTDTAGFFTSIRDFDANQRLTFYSNLYSTEVNGNTPLRSALNKIGRYYANDFSAQSDPVQHACQRNFTLLTSDGYWNDTGSFNRPSSLGGTSIGNQDGNLSDPWSARPVYDGNNQSNTLADIAAYYYKTDLRPSLSNNVTATDSDPAAHQHMTTYTLGLGLSGVLKYDPNYLTQTSGDFADIKAGTKNWPAPTTDPARVDDLWHAAVNGRGRYFSANDPEALTNSLAKVLSDFTSRDGVGAAAASSTLRPVITEDLIFLASYRTKDWYGDLEARTITRVNGQLSAGPANKVWSAAVQLNATPFGQRNILYARRQLALNGTTTSLAAFNWANISSDVDSSTLLNHFNRFCEQGTIPSQCSALTSEQKNAAKGENLVNFLRGDRSLEGILFRSREFVLGDIVDASPVFVGAPPFNYTGQDYPAYKSAQANRCPMVYVAANDGMLHAFSAKKADEAGSTSPTTTNDVPTCSPGGSEVWAYVPRAVMSNMYLLADRNYATNHRFYVNGTPVVGDIGETSVKPDGSSTTNWRTILVGGFGAGGRGYYALDITNPSSPASLWEFSDSDMGLSYGNPIITQIADAEGSTTWVVAFTSGLNNSGNGFLYILNAKTGALLYKIPTNVNGGAVGTASAPSGLNKLNAWVESPTYNLALRFYAGDMRGNLWRFDASNLTPPAANASDNRAVRLANLTVNNTPQPITIRPELALVNYGGYQHPVVLVGTGRYLGINDVESTAMQSIYAIKDPLTGSGWGNVRPNLVEQTLSAYNESTTVRTLTKQQVDWNSSTVAGWYIDLPDSGERVVTNMGLAFTTLTVASLVPKADVCSGDGYSWVYNLNIGTGSYVKEGPVAGEKSDKAVMGISVVQVVEGDSEETVGLNTKSNGSISFTPLPKESGGSAGLRRTSWRELLPSGQ